MVNEKPDNDGSLDRLLNERYEPAAPEGLAARIVAAAHREQPAAQARGRRIPLSGRLQGWAAEFGEFFLLPRPALAVAVCLIVGAVAGFEAQAQMMPGDIDWSSFLDVNEDWI
jgi:hypothetical protein